MVWGYIQYGGAREICKVDRNIDSAKYQQILASVVECVFQTSSWWRVVV